MATSTAGPTNSLKTTEPFRLVYDGPALREGLMDARDLSHALLDLGETISRTNYLLNGEHATVTLRIRAAEEPGSFPAILEIFQELQQTLLDSELVSPRIILEHLGLATVAMASESEVIGNLIDLWKLLRGEKARVVETDTETNTATVEVDGESNKVNQNVLNMYGDTIVHQHFPGVFRPLQKSGVDSVEAIHGGELVRRLSQKDAEEIALTSWGEDEELEERTDEMTAEIITPQFREGYKWRFFSNLLGKFTASMLDKSFLASLEKGKDRFGYGDWLRFRMRTRTVEAEEEKSVEYEIVEVLEVVHAPRQSRIES